MRTFKICITFPIRSLHQPIISKGFPPRYDQISSLAVISGGPKLSPASHVRNLPHDSAQSQPHDRYPLVICYVAIEHGHGNNEFSHEKW